jgi:iron-sulfur cluster repair protein YtfE (RIC family)
MTNVSPTEEDVASLLLKTHDAGRSVLSAALRILREGGEDEVIRYVAATVVRFMSLVSLRHELDEEQIVIPALRAHGPRSEVEAALAYIFDDHLVHEGLREQLRLRWQRVADAAAELGPVREELLSMTEQFAHVLERHARHEELVVFPLVRKYVSLGVRAAMMAVLASREQMAPLVLPSGLPASRDCLAIKPVVPPKR